MLTRTVLGALAAAAIAAGGSTTVLVTASGNQQGLAQRSPRAGEAQQAKTEGTQAAEVQLPPCPADVKNHGAYVSSVAKANRGHGADESADHGALVSAAAQSDCGKPAGGDGTEDAADARTSEQKAADKAERDAAKAARKAARESAGPGKSDEPHGSAGTTGQATPTP